MNTRLAILLLLATTLVLRGGETNSLQDVIRAFPDVYEKAYRPDEAVRSANALIAAGERRAFDALWYAGRYQDSSWEPSSHEKVLLLCRLVFRAKDHAKPMPLAYDGLIMPVEPEDRLRWPDYPFVITNGVALLLPRFVSSPVDLAVHGSERGATYVERCERCCRIRAESFPTPTVLTASNAVRQILASPDWQAMKWDDSARRSLGEAPREWGEKRMWEQVENMKKPMADLRPPGRNRMDKPVLFPEDEH